MRILYSTEFIWIEAGDRNRAEDGLELRERFLTETRSEYEPNWYDSPCSILEVLIALAQAASFQTELPHDFWFWRFISNLGLEEYRRVSNSDIPIIEDILHTFKWRTYNSDGCGGLFPMRLPKHDQRKVELWYQFHEYLDNHGLV